LAPAGGVRQNPVPGTGKRDSRDTLRTYTITEAADLTGLSRKAIARRVERGSLRSVVRNGRRRIPRSELVRNGLLEDTEKRPPAGGPSSPLQPRPGVGTDLELTGTTEDMLASLFREVLDRFERQSQEIAQFRALTVQAESLRLTNELADLRMRLAELERQPQEQPQQQPQTPPQRPQPPSVTTELGRRVHELSKQVEELSQREIWLPPHASSPQQAQAQPAAPQPRPAGPARTAPPQAAPRPVPRRPRRYVRTIRFIVEALFIVAVAVIAWQADLPTPAIFVAMAVAWTLVAVIEWFSSERPVRR
jgi:excisionase family DNA binding protein